MLSKKNDVGDVPPYGGPSREHKPPCGRCQSAGLQPPGHVRSWLFGILWSHFKPAVVFDVDLGPPGELYW